MTKTFLFDPIQILYNSTQAIELDAVLICNGQIKGFGKDARKLAKDAGIHGSSANEKLIAPCLVDPHSFLIDPINGRNETLKSLKEKAANAGYGQIALLPKGKNWRDKPALMNGFNNSTSDIYIHLWGSFSLGGKGKELAPHADLIDHGAIGIAECDSLPPAEILRKGLLTNELGKNPLLLAPRDPDLQGDGIVRESVETFRAGWTPNPLASETLPISQLLELQKEYQNINLKLMNISTQAGVSLLANYNCPPNASACWWNLIADNSNLNPSDIGWRVLPSLGTPTDRHGLIKGLEQSVLTAIAVHAIALDDSEVKGPPEQRLSGISGHQLVLPCLWDELIVKEGWTIEKLWDALSFGPSRFLNSPQEKLSIDSRRWLIFDPKEKWRQLINQKESKVAANEPFENKEITGKIILCGLNA